ncbi:hypothetical protein VNI00_013864 [Paramarasmius palmivorus]|uniref:Uncharacterized protein n=1 Tax=Paramarasmius palmivorus TaxID=297713 RepID=A0AAW0BXE9_9AGAR
MELMKISEEQFEALLKWYTEWSDSGMLAMKVTAKATRTDKPARKRRAVSPDQRSDSDSEQDELHSQGILPVAASSHTRTDGPHFFSNVQCQKRVISGGAATAKSPVKASPLPMLRGVKRSLEDATEELRYSRSDTVTCVKLFEKALERFQGVLEQMND